MSSDSSNEAPSSPAEPPRPRPGGLSPAPKGHLQPVFTLLMTWVFIDVLALLIIPFTLNRGTDSLWAQPPRLAFFGLSILAGTLFGLLASVFADRRGHSAWWYLAGHLGAWAAPAVVLAGTFESSPFVSRLIVLGCSALGALGTLFLVGSRPRSEAKPITALTRNLSLLMHRVGSIKLGIVLMVILVAALGYGTEMENQYGGRAAKAIVYTSGWMSLLFVLFTASLVSATLRKFPWRIDQAGWITIHSALVILVVGAFLTFWGKKEGNVELFEGEKASEFVLSTETRFHVLDESGQPVWNSIVSFDRNPAEREPDQSFEVTREGKHLFGFSVDRYFADARLVPAYHNDGPQRRSALRITSFSGGSEDSFLLEEGRPAFPMGEFLKFRTIGQVDDARYQALISGNLSPAKGMVMDFAYRGGGDWFALLHGTGGKPRLLPLVRGQRQDFGPQFGLRVDEFFTHLRVEGGWEFEAYQPRREVCRIKIEGDPDPRWLSLVEKRRSHTLVTKDGERFLLRWSQGRHPLGFELELHDFHRDFYPGSNVAKTFESHLTLRHPEKFKEGAKITIDMNHPLVIDGWRLYQHRFGEGSTESTILQVNNDPGLELTYFGCLILGLGLVVAFFQKPCLRAIGRLLKTRSAGPQYTFFYGCLATLLCALGTMPGMLVFVALEEGPIMLLGVFAIILGLIAETQFVNRWIKPRVELKLQALKATPAPSVGES